MTSLIGKQQTAFDAAIGSVTDGGGGDTRIFGCAGSGKSFVLSEVYKALRKDHPHLSLHVVAPTNKAVNVVRSRGVSSASTIHSFLYVPKKRIRQDAQGKPKKLPNGEWDTELYFVHRMDHGEIDQPDVVLVDECSMVGGKLYNDMRRLPETTYIWFGDPFQLPPVKDEEVFKCNPDVFLDEIHRTQAGNPVLKLAMEIRNHGEPYPSLGLFDRAPISSGIGQQVLESDTMVISWTNRRRRKLNTLKREKRSLPSTQLSKGDRLICLENKGGLYNGQFATILNEPETGEITSLLDLQVEGEDKPKENVLVSMREFLNTWGQEKYAKTLKFPRPSIAFDWAYAITCHKSQGSEWPSIAVVDERWMMGRLSEQEKARWFYTAVTRTRDELVFLT